MHSTETNNETTKFENKLMLMSHLDVLTGRRPQICKQCLPTVRSSLKTVASFCITDIEKQKEWRTNQFWLVFRAILLNPNTFIISLLKTEHK